MAPFYKYSKTNHVRLHERNNFTLLFHSAPFQSSPLPPRPTILHSAITGLPHLLIVRGVGDQPADAIKRRVWMVFFSTATNNWIVVV